ncbi:hypothetical protein MKZ38_003109 [Zalerion maritima]|uniref:Uncharacterized protein n=1 Tax=Zalerion maritima TaxID=339359 RepID=A0AAD5RWT9_9PEZI|nr:hypothetical protein MKZ38_003109 [Zalerion maritima]
MATSRIAASMLLSRSSVVASRTLHTSSRLANVAAAPPPLPARKPVGAFRGGDMGVEYREERTGMGTEYARLFGFLLGSTLAGSGVYYYVLQEYKASNELLTEDIYALQNAITRVAQHLTSVEDKMDLMEKKSKR